MEYLPWLLPIVGVLSILSGIRTLFASASFRSRAQPATAEITDRRWEGSGRGSRMVPVVRFTLPDGRTVETEITAGANPLGNWEGHTVEVLYDPEDPTQARVEGLLGSGGSGASRAILIGVLFLLIGVALAVSGA